MNEFIYAIPVAALFHAYGSRLQGSGETWAGFVTFYAASLVFAGLLFNLDIKSMFSEAHVHIFGVLLSLGYILGEKTGWGGVIGPMMIGSNKTDREHWWLSDSLKDNASLASVVRGFIWAVPILLSIAAYILFAGKYLPQGELSLQVVDYLPLMAGVLVAFLSCFIVSIKLSRMYYTKTDENVINKAGVTLDGDKIWWMSERIRGAYLVFVIAAFCLLGSFI